MNKILTLLLCGFLQVSLFAQTSFPVNLAHEKKIAQHIKTMTLAEKVGQTCQITLDAILVTNNKGQSKEPAEIDRNKLRIALDSFKVGSILNVSSHTLKPSEWKYILSEIKAVSDELNTKIPIIYGIDAIHGLNYAVGATLFPQEIGLAATWNRNLARTFAEITAYEMRAMGLKWNFSPVLDLARQPLWSRFFETLGEDPYLASVLGEQIILGYQGTGKIDEFHVASCLKHFVGYSAPLSGRDRTPAWIPAKYMTELYLPAFKKAIDAGAMTLMINSGDVNGIPGHINKYLLTDLLKEKWGFRGFTVSDWEDFIFLKTVHQVAGSIQDAAAMAFNAGVDMSMVPGNPQYKEYCEAMIKAVKEKQISMKRLDDAVSRILRVKYAIGLFDETKSTGYPDYGSEKFQKVAYESAAESITLLKNENNFLPLDKSKKVLVVGPTANSLNFLNGAWTHTWQGVDTSYNTEGCLTIAEALKEKVGASNFLFTQGAELYQDKGWEQTRLVEVADFKEKVAQVDVVVLCLGELPSTEKPGDIRSLNLSNEQMTLAKMAYEMKKPVLLVLVEARPRIIHEIVEQASGIIQCYLPGDYGAKALADIIYGDINPSGKLPYTYPKYDGVIEYYDRPRSVDRSGKTEKFDAFDPEWEFGFGLSYTQFEYANLIAPKKEMTSKDTLTFTVEIKNTGEISGKEVVQMYIMDQVSSYVPAGKRLRNFEKIELNIGESKTVQFKITAEDLRFADCNGKWILEPGLFDVLIGNQKVTIELK